MEQLTFIPEENYDATCVEVREWIKANAFMAINDRPWNVHALERFSGGHISLDLGDYMVDPDNPSRRADIGTQFDFSVGDSGRTTYVDPEGTTWYKYCVHATLNFGSSSSTTGVRVLRQHVNMIEGTMQLLERFMARFTGVEVWVRGEAKADREARLAKAEAARKALVSQQAVEAAIKEAIHTTCRGMRVGSDRFISKPAESLDGESEVELENKTYKVSVGCGIHGNLMHFERIK